MSATRPVHQIRKADMSDLGRLKPEARALVESLSTSGHMLIASYEFGASIYAEGAFQPPCDSCEDCQGLRRYIKETPNLLACSLDRGLEVYRRVGAADQDGRTQPLRMLQPGELFGVFEVLDASAKLGAAAAPQWRVSAGARTWQILNSTKDGRLLDNAEKKGVFLEGPPQDDFTWVREIAKLHSVAAWSTEVFFLPVSDSAPKSALLGLYQLGWQQSQALRMEGNDEVRVWNAWASISNQVHGKHLREFGRTITYLLGACRGALPLMVPTGQFHDLFGPVSEFERLFGEIMPQRSHVYTLIPGHLSDACPAGVYSFVEPPHLLLEAYTKDFPKIGRRWESLWGKRVVQEIFGSMRNGYQISFLNCGKSAQSRRGREAGVDDLIEFLSHRDQSSTADVDNEQRGEALENASRAPYFNGFLLIRKIK